MKKKWNGKILKHMRNLFLLLLISASSVWARDGYSQGTQEIISVKNGTIESIFKQIKRQCHYEFFYNTAVVDVKENVSLALTEGTLEEILQQVLGNKYCYSIKDNYILISQKKVASLEDVKKITIKGIVKDKGGDVLPGVSVLLKGTSIGVATDVKGEFTLTIPEQDTIVLRFSFIGMKLKDVVYKPQSRPIIVVLEDDVTEMEEVVVTGYQEIKKERMTGSTETITSRDIMNKGYSSVEEVLKGQMAGVATMSISGRPGAAAQIRIRGINSLTGDMEPMWIVDGMPLQGDVPEVSMGGTEFQETVLTSGIGNISPDDIESITVLKDAAATAIYGSRAANGVIVIKTKRGTVGKSYLNIQAAYGVSEAPENRLVMMNTQQKIAYERGIYEDFSSYNLSGRVYQLLRDADRGSITREDAEKRISELGKTNTDWFKEIFRVAQTQNYSVTLSGGDEITQYYASLSYSSQEGVMPNNRYETFGGSLKLTHDFNSWLRVYFDILGSLRNDRNSASAVNPLEYATYANPYERLYEDNGEWAYDRSYTSKKSTVSDGYMYDFNILKDLNENTSKTRYLSNQFNLKLEFKIVEGLMFSTMGTFSNSNNHMMTELLPGSYTSNLNSWVKNLYEGETPNYLNKGQLSESTSRSQSWTIRNQLTYARGFGEDEHYVNILLGHEVSSSKGYGFSSMIPEWSPVYGVATYPDLEGFKMGGVSLTSLGRHTESQDRSVSVFITGSYSYKDRYVVAASARMDGADIIGTKNRFSPLWNVSGKWNLHNESFMENWGFVNQLALRVSYGFTGSIDRNALPFSLLTLHNDTYEYDGIELMDDYQPGNPSIKWQRKEDRNVGFDASLLNNRINLSVNYYHNDTRNLLDSKSPGYSAGKASITANVASLRNSGWEIALRTLNVKTEDFTWTTSFNFTRNKNVVTETYYKNIDDVSVNVHSGMEGLYNLFIEGESVAAYYGFKYAGVDPATGGALAYIDRLNENGEQIGSLYKDGRYVANMDENPTAEEKRLARVYLGESEAPYFGGFTTSFMYKNISLSANFTYMTGHLIPSFQSMTSTGGDIYNSEHNVLAIEANRWRKPGDVTDKPRYRVGENSSYLYDIYDFRFEKGDYLKCTNISLGYNFTPQLCSKLHLTRMRLNFNVSNVFTLTKYRGIDPENMGAFGYPSARKYNLSISIGI